MARRLLCTCAIAARAPLAATTRRARFVAAVKSTEEGSNVPDRILRTVHGLRWDIKILWRLDNGAWSMFGDAPDEVVSRWAATDPNTVHRHQLHNAILAARDELALRERQVPVEFGSAMPVV
jgi:hypothetical protein